MMLDWKDNAAERQVYAFNGKAQAIDAGHMSEVARRLGIGRSTLYRKVREQGLEGLVKGAGDTADAEEVAAA